MQETHVYWSNNPHQYIRDNIGISISQRNHKKNILYLIQADFRADASNNIGGTQLHVKDLTMELKSMHNIFVAARDEEMLRVTAYIDDQIFSFKYYIGSIPSYPIFFDEVQRKIYATILNGFKIDLVHVHHTLSLSLDIYYEAQKLGIPVILSLHDFYYVCPTFLLLNVENKLCIDKANDEMCSICLSKKMGISDKSYYISKWRTEIEKVLLMCKQIIIPSQSAKDIFCKYYPHLRDEIKVINHGSERIEVSDYQNNEEILTTSTMKSNVEYAFNQEGNPYSISGWAYLEGVDSKKSTILIEVINSDNETQVLKCYATNRVDVARINQNYLKSGFSVVLPRHLLENGEVKVRLLIKHEEKFYTDGKMITSKVNVPQLKSEFNVAFIGGISLAKGSQMAYQLIKNSHEDINWYILGGIGDSDLYNIQKPNLIKTGWYDRADLPMLLKEHKIDLVCILSIVPETFCFTLSETLLNHIPVLVTDIGALGERVKSMQCGWVVPVEADYREVLKQIESIKSDKKGYEETVDRIEKIRIKTIEEMGIEYNEIYHSYLDQAKEIHYEAVEKKELYSMGTTLNMGVAELNSFLYQRLNAVETELGSIHASITYKILMRLKRIRLPFKKQIKRAILGGAKLLRR